MSSPNFSSIESKYNEPLDGKYHVANLAVAVANDTDYNTPNMVVFVRNEKSFYYLKDGALGNNTTHWQKFGDNTTLVFPPFVGTKIYGVGETCAVGTNMFICIATTVAGESPSTHPAKWLQVGATGSYTQTVTNITDVDITHNIPNGSLDMYETITNRRLNVLITRTNNTQFKIQSNQAVRMLSIESM